MQSRVSWKGAQERLPKCLFMALTYKVLGSHGSIYFTKM